MQTSNPFKNNALINGSLVVFGFPKDMPNPVGKFLVYRVVDDRAWYWWVTENKLKALENAQGIWGHIEQIRTFERR